MPRGAETELAEKIRAACLEAARKAHDDALARGLCAEGALEAALGAIEMLDLKAIMADLEKGKPQ